MFLLPRKIMPGLVKLGGELLFPKEEQLLFWTIGRLEMAKLIFPSVSALILFSLEKRRF